MVADVNVAATSNLRAFSTYVHGLDPGFGLLPDGVDGIGSKSEDKGESGPISEPAFLPVHFAVDEAPEFAAIMGPEGHQQRASPLDAHLIRGA